MVRNYKPKEGSRKRNTTRDDVEKAVVAVFKNYLPKKNSFTHGAFSEAAAGLLPPTTLMSYCKGYKTAEEAMAAYDLRYSSCQQLSHDDEEELYKIVVQCWRSNGTLPSEVVMGLAANLAQKRGTPFKSESGFPSEDWYRAFCKRWKLTDRACSAKATFRDIAEQKQVIEVFFNGCDETFEELGETYHWAGWYEMLEQPCDTHDPDNSKKYKDCPLRIGNADETNLGSETDTKVKGCAPIGAKIVNVQGDEDENGTTCFTASTTAQFLPHQYIRQGTLWTDNWIKFALPGSKGKKRADGITWVEFKGILENLADCIPGGVSPTFRFLFLLDSHGSRLHPDCIKKAKELGFDIFLLPGSLTAILQPWDSLFGVVKGRYYKKLRIIKQKGLKANLQLKIKCWAEAFLEIFDGTAGAQKISNSFILCGIYPPSLEAAVARLERKKERNKLLLPLSDIDAPATDPTHIELRQMASTTVASGSSKKRKQVKESTIRSFFHEDSGDEEDGHVAKKSKRVNIPRWITGNEYERLQNDLREKAAQETQRKEDNKKEREKKREEKIKAKEVAAKKREKNKAVPKAVLAKSKIQKKK
eukprot:Lithocolla_globosa_v1_NODE_1571_length_2478_cov_4.521255.p1 type:complete len:587 gc:universal NODE_1571_length_2478_cov_4.521255:2243-483(-)